MILAPLILAPSISCPLHIYHDVHDFHKGIKRDITLNPIFKDDQQYDSWYHTIASVHGTEDVFDSHYNPTETFQVLLLLETKWVRFLCSARIYKCHSRSHAH